MPSTARFACGPAGVPGAMWPVSWAGLLDAPAGGGLLASRPRREPSARRVVSKPGQAPPPPTGAAARPRRRPRAPQPGPASKPARALRSLWCPPHQRCLAAVVPPVGIAGASRVAISGRSFACCYKRRQSDGVFAENSGFWAQIDDVCNVVRPRAPQPGRVGQLGRLSETVVAFAGAGRASTETAIAFAGAK